MNQTKPLTITIDDLTQTRADYPPVLHMRWPVDEETTVSLRLLTHQRLPIRRRLLRWITRRWKSLNRVGC